MNVFPHHLPPTALFLVAAEYAITWIYPQIFSQSPIAEQWGYFQYLMLQIPNEEPPCRGSLHTFLVVALGWIPRTRTTESKEMQLKYSKKTINILEKKQGKGKKNTIPPHKTSY